MRITDTHVHLWDPRIRSYPWLQGRPELNAPRLAADLAGPANGPADETGSAAVAKIVLIEADCRPDQAPAEALWLQDQARLDPRIGAVVAAVRLEDDAGLPAALERLHAIPLVRGVRRNFQALAPGALTAPAMLAGARAVAAAGLVFDATVRCAQLPELEAFARQVPELTVVLDHLGKPPVAGGAVGPWARDLQRLASCSNVSVKISGLAPEANPAKPLQPQIRPFLAAALDVADPARLLLGSDWPVSTARTPLDTYASWWTLLLEDTLTVLSPPERAAVAEGNAERIYMKAGTAHE